MDGTGDPLYTAWGKVNANFTEVYGRLPSLALTGIVAADSGSGLYRVAVLADFAPFLGIANGMASLDGSGKIPTSQLPSAALGGLDYQGTWNASTNSPAIPVASSANKGYYYKVSVAGTTSISGINDWGVGDWIVSNGSSWDKVDNSESVGSVAGLTGIISGASLKTALSISYSDISGLGSAAQKTAGAANGVATLDGAGKLTPSQSRAIFTQQYTSSDQAITAGGALTLAHGLGVKPLLTRALLVCQTAEYGYSVGDEVEIKYYQDNSGSGNVGIGMAVVSDATNVNIRFGGHTNPIYLISKDTGAAVGITPANWKLRFIAWA